VESVLKTAPKGSHVYELKGFAVNLGSYLDQRTLVYFLITHLVREHNVCNIKCYRNLKEAFLFCFLLVCIGVDFFWSSV